MILEARDLGSAAVAHVDARIPMFRRVCVPKQARVQRPKEQVSTNSSSLALGT